MHVGWDWASQNHDVTVIDDTGTIHARFAIDHDEASLRTVLRDLALLGGAGRLAGGDRTTRRHRRRALARRRSCRRAGAPERLSRRPPALGCRTSEVRPG